MLKLLLECTIILRWLYVKYIKQLTVHLVQDCCHHLFGILLTNFFYVLVSLYGISRWRVKLRQDDSPKICPNSGDEDHCTGWDWKRIIISRFKQLNKIASKLSPIIQRKELHYGTVPACLEKAFLRRYIFYRATWHRRLTEFRWHKVYSYFNFISIAVLLIFFIRI